MQRQEGVEGPQAIGGEDSSKTVPIISATEENERRLKEQKLSRDRAIEEEILATRGHIVPNLPEFEGDTGGSRVSAHRRRASDTWMQAQIEAREKDVQEQIAMKRRSVYEDVKSMRLAATAVVYEMEGAGGGGATSDEGSSGEAGSELRKGTVVLDESLRPGGTVRIMAERFKGGTGRIETNATAHNRVMSQEITDRRARNSAKVMLEQPQFHGEGLYTDFLKRYRNGGTAQDKAQFLRAWVRHCREKGHEVSLEDGQKFLKELGISKTVSTRMQPLKPGSTTSAMSATSTEDPGQSANVYSDWMLALQDALNDDDDPEARATKPSAKSLDDAQGSKLPTGPQTTTISVKVQPAASYKDGASKDRASSKDGASNPPWARSRSRAGSLSESATARANAGTPLPEDNRVADKGPEGGLSSSAKVRTPRLELDESEHPDDQPHAATHDGGEDRDKPTNLCASRGRASSAGQSSLQRASSKTEAADTSNQAQTSGPVAKSGALGKPRSMSAAGAEHKPVSEEEWQVLNSDGAEDEEDKDGDSEEERADKIRKHIVLLDNVIKSKEAPARQLSGNVPKAPPPSVKTKADVEEEKWDTSISAMEDTVRVTKEGPLSASKEEDEASKAEKRKAKRAERRCLCSWLCMPCCGESGGTDSP